MKKLIYYVYWFNANKLSYLDFISNLLIYFLRNLCDVPLLKHISVFDFYLGEIYLYILFKISLYFFVIFIIFLSAKMYFLFFIKLSLIFKTLNF